MEDTEDVPVVEAFVPDDPSIETFHSLSLKEKLRVIRLGLAFRSHGENKTRMWENEDWEQRILEMQDAHKKRVESLLREQAQMKESLATTIRDQERSRASIQIEQLNVSNTELTSRVSGLLDQLQAVHSSLDEKYMARLQEERERHESKMQQAEEKLATLRGEYEQAISRGVNSTLKGKDGEVFVFGQLNMLFPKAEIEDTHNIPHRGDFILREGAFTMMIETKNYSRNVQKAEVDKFYRDIDNPANADIQCAVFVSLTTGICNKDDFCFEIRNMIPILFIHNLSSNFELLLLAVKFFRLINDQSGIDLSCKEVVDAYKNLAGTLKRGFSKQRNRLDKFYSEQMTLIAEQETAIGDLYAITKLKY